MGDRREDPQPLTRALAWLAHPVSLAALAAMALNDHVLKAAYGTWWTGKLSDAAGLVFFPALLGVVFAAAARLARVRVTARALVWASAAATVLGFVWVKATEAGAWVASELLSTLAGPSLLRNDTSDLLALPALALTVWIGLRPMRPAAENGIGPVPESASNTLPRRPRARLVLAWLVLPFAVLASVATSYEGDDPSASVVEGPHGTPFVEVQGMDVWETDGLYTWAGDRWWQVDPQAYALSGWEGADGYAVPQHEQCVPGKPRVCYRATHDGIGVEASEDGGDTWRLEWGLSDAQVGDLNRQYNAAYGTARTDSVGVFLTESGYMVVAGNGADGLAIRHEDGTWERTGFAGLECCSDAPLAEIGPVSEYTGKFLLPMWLLLGLLLPVAVTPVAGVVVFGPPRGLGVAHTLRMVAGWAAAVATAGLVALAAWQNLALAPRPGEDPVVGAGGLSVIAAVALACGAAAVGALGLLREQAQAATLVMWGIGTVVTMGVAAGAGAIAFHAEAGVFWPQLGAAAAACIGSFAAMVVWQRQRLARDEDGILPA